MTHANSVGRTEQERMGRNSSGLGPENNTSDANQLLDTILSSLIGRIGTAPPPEAYSSTTTPSIGALLEKERILQGAIISLQSRSNSVIEGIRKHQRHQECIVNSSLSTIRQHRNRFIPVVRLPPEILSQIFVFGAQMVDSKDWIATACTSSRVCKRWRQIALDCPELWSHLDFHNCHPPRWLAKIVERSRSAPLSLIYSDRAVDWSTRDGEMALIVNNVPRFKSINLDVLFSRRDDMARLFKMFNQPAPALQHLTISSPCNSSTFSFPREFLGGCTPNLRHVKLSTDYYVPWDSAFLANLTTLDVAGPRSHGGPPISSLEELFGALTRMPELEDLTLRSCIPSPSQPARGYAHVDLLNLKRLQLRDGPKHCADFLRQITVNASATLGLGLECDNLEDSDVYYRILDVFRSPWTTPTPTEALDFNWDREDLREFEINAWPVQQPDLEVTDSGNASIRLGLRRVPSHLWPLGVARACFAAFASPQLLSFRLSDNIIKWGIDVWRDVAHMAPGLRRLAVGKASQAAELCMALCPPSDGSGINPVAADCCFPALSYLELAVRYDYAMPTPDGGEAQLSTALAHTLAARAAVGCSTPELVFVTPHSEKFPEGWSEPFMKAVPGIIVREQHAGMEKE